MKRIAIAAAAAALVLVGCSSTPATSPSGSESPTSGASTSTTPTPSESSSGSASGEASPSPSQSTILAVLCDKATESQVAAIRKSLKPDFTAKQFIDVRQDDDGQHAILAFVEGPGLSVLATWYGTGLDLEGLSSADDLAAQASEAPLGTPDADTADLLGQTATCYQTLFAPPGFGDDDGGQDDQQDDKDDKDDKKDNKDDDQDN